MRGQEISACGGDSIREKIVFTRKIQLSLNKSQQKAKITIEEFNLLVTEGLVVTRFSFLNAKIKQVQYRDAKRFLS